MTVVIGTAGHIDHGKTTLLRALTGIDADRLPEERARGMTIDVGYAHLVLDDGSEIDFVDVPGHDRLVGNMLVGAGEIDAALVVVAADDGPRAQTREHLELLDGLGIDDGVVAITKTDAVDAERVAEVVAEARSLVRATTLGDILVLPVSALTGDGLDALRVALLALRDRVLARRQDRDGRSVAAREAAPSAPARLAIDRVFTIRGRGTVVTGTLRGAPIDRDDVLRVVPAGPGGGTVRAREVQVHGQAVARADPDGRVALNVVGDGASGLARGTVLTSDPAVVASDRWLVALRPVVELPRGPVFITGRRRTLPTDRMPVTVHVGTAHAPAVLGRSGRDLVDLGNGEGTAILRLARPLAVRPGDRFVLRRASPVETLAGGRVLDPEPPWGVARRRATPERVTALAATVAGSKAWHAARLELHGATAGAPSGLAADVAAAIDAAILAAVDARPGIRSAEVVRTGAAELRRRAGALGPAPGSSADSSLLAADARLDELVVAGRLTRDGDRIAPSGAVAAGPSPALVEAMDRLVAALSTVSPPSLAAAARDAACPPEGIRLLEQANRIVRLEDNIAWAFPTWRVLAARALELAGAGPLSPAALRDATGTSRKYVMAILEDLDRRAILRRTPAGHLPGPRAAQFAALHPPTQAEAVPSR